MSYITLQGLIDRYGETELVQLTDAIGTGQVDTAKVDRTIADADAEIDSYLVGLGILPISAASPARLPLQRIGGVMVRYYLYKDAPPDLVKDQYADAIRFLKDVSRGIAHLGPAESGAATPETAAPSWSTTDSVFNSNAMRGF